MDIHQLIIFLVGFALIAIASNQIAKVLQKINFPIITGLIITGIIAGSSVLNFITPKAIEDLNFLNEIALSIIAFSAGSELFLNDLRSRLNSIKWMTIGQLVITFVLSAVVIFFIAGYIPFMKEMNSLSKIAVSILFATIFVARSPSSAIAVINEMRANGPFTKTVMGVTVVKDVLVIILFAICFSIAKAFINGEEIGFFFLVILLLEIAASFALGVIVGKILIIPFAFSMHKHLQGLLVILIGYSVYLFAHFVKIESAFIFEHAFLIEPLLICIIASFMLTNYSKHRIEFSKLLHEIGPLIFIVFFTLTGASLSLQVLMSVYGIAIALFFLRLFTMMLGGAFGVLAAKDDKKYIAIAWMPFLTQAGVALGLATIVAKEFPEWGHEFETIVIAIIVINQLVGPPLFKYALNVVKETHLRAKTPEFDGTRDAVIFGIENQSIALAAQLEKHKWATRIVCLKGMKPADSSHDIIQVDEISIKVFKELQLKKVESIVLMFSDAENYKIAELLYEYVGTKDIIVRLNERENFEKFHKLGVLIIEPATAMVSLMDHFVRSPNATSLLLGMDEGQDTLDIEIRNNDIHGLHLRDLRLPSDIIVLSVKRKGQMIISHGYTRLRLGDIMTMVGSEDSLEEIKIKFDS
ncbi:MAG: potassium transporter TrkA [Flavobacteriaceae bacterium]|nr:MAG: potassium transporter TrkA [Flavobacteriaceae bacterium]